MQRLWGLCLCGLLAGCVSGEAAFRASSGPLAGRPAYSGPMNLPPPGYTSEFWIDRRGCTFVATGSGEWVPQLNLDRTPKCDRTLAWEPEDIGPQPVSVPVPSEFVDPVTGVRTVVMAPVPIAPSYVQVGHFLDREKGLAARSRFLSMGFPVVGGDGDPPPGPGLSLVLGPFTEAGLLGDGLDTARALGFTGAFSFEN